jgi:hypothetical protein
MLRGSAPATAARSAALATARSVAAAAPAASAARPPRPPRPLSTHRRPTHPNSAPPCSTRPRRFTPRLSPPHRSPPRLRMKRPLAVWLRGRIVGEIDAGRDGGGDAVAEARVRGTEFTQVGGETEAQL